VNYFSRNADNAIVARFLGDVPLGHYQMAYNLMLYPIQNISSVVAQVLLPALSRIKHDNDRFQSAYVRSCALIGLITFPVIAGLGVVADPFVRALLGDQWIPAIVVFQILAPVGMVQSVQTTVGQIYVAKGRTDWMFRWGLFGCAVLVPAFLVGIPYGVVGVATAYCIAYLVLMAIPGFVIPFRLINLRFAVFARELAPQLGMTMLMVAVCWLWLRQLEHLLIGGPWTRLISSTCLGASVYVGGLLLVRPAALKHLEQVIDESHSQLAPSILLILRVFARA
jgi:PST family polysaccharide transporter